MTHYQKTESGILVPFAPHVVRRAYAEVEAATSVGYAGLYKLTVRAADGSVKRETDWFNNLILNTGLNQIGTASGVTLCEIGFGSGAAVATETQLQSFAARTSTVSSGPTTSNSGSPDYYIASTITFRFALGALNGNYNEVGVGWAANNLFSRALITPTSITVLSDEQLDVTYQLRCYMPTTDWGGTYTISGTSYDVIGRRALAANAEGLSVGTGATRVRVFSGGQGFQYSYPGVIGAITSSPSGGEETVGGVVDNAYVNNSLTATGTWTFALANATSGVRSVRIRGGGIPQVQYQFTPIIPKTNANTLVLNFQTTWARRP